MKRWTSILTAVVAATLLALSPGIPAKSGTEQAASNPLTPFEQLIGGEWHLEGSYQKFEWGVGRRSVKSRSYFVVDGSPKLVSEGIWFWHPGTKEIKGVFTAIHMPVTFFDYTTRFEDRKMVNDLRAYGSSGKEMFYIETWDFTDDMHFNWKLLRKTPAGLQEEMGGTYTRK